MSENSPADGMIEVHKKPRRTPRLPTWLLGLLIVALAGWYAWEFFGPTTGPQNTEPKMTMVTAGQMAQLCQTATICGESNLERYQYQERPFQFDRYSSTNIQFVTFITTPTAQGRCPTWLLPSPIQANFTDASGKPAHLKGGDSITVTACDPVFYVDPNGVVH